MSEPRGTPEASMEEILASIRRIISEDGSPPAPQSVGPQSPAPQVPPRPPVGPTPVSPAAATSSAAASIPVAPPPPTSPALQPLPPSAPTGPASVWGVPGDRQAASGDELVLTQMLAEDGSVLALDRPAAAVAPANTAFVEPSTPQPLDVLLLTNALPSGSPESLMRSNAALSQLAPDRVRDGAPTVEELVRQSLEPKIQEWLNANLKDIVERLVQEEIERISRRAE